MPPVAGLVVTHLPTTYLFRVDADGLSIAEAFSDFVRPCHRSPELCVHQCTIDLTHALLHLPPSLSADFVQNGENTDGDQNIAHHYSVRKLLEVSATVPWYLCICHAWTQLCAAVHTFLCLNNNMFLCINSENVSSVYARVCTSESGRWLWWAWSFFCECMYHFVLVRVPFCVWLSTSYQICIRSIQKYIVCARRSFRRIIRQVGASCCACETMIHSLRDVLKQRRSRQRY